MIDLGKHFFKSLFEEILIEITIIILLPITKYQISTYNEHNETNESCLNIIVKLHPIPVMTVVNWFFEYLY